MKKFLPILLLAFVSLFIFSCDNNDDNHVDSDTVAVMKDATGTFSSANNFQLIMDINIESTDVVLVYKHVGDAWQLIPKLVILPDVAGMPSNRIFQYNFVFDTKKVQIRIDDENFNLTTGLNATETAQYLSNQTFRVVLVPANATGKNSKSAKSAGVDYNDYNAVVKYFNLNDSNVTNTKVN
ncbi:hypothetical protein [Chryseobacterium limigenitum]|uniref:DUF4382 domain-containing protein n=1 Tax=Chryseobacterium limigenitum TaxID=1612149 RepID=A0A1K2IG47_9FLAO|nr:hypothetical protein [Chryseobacterium limigenitum]SFZ91385.1 hypothetical protein SAMN05216324_102333 [Chryseobacterium limigenitum]